MMIGWPSSSTTLDPLNQFQKFFMPSILGNIGRGPLNPTASLIRGAAIASLSGVSPSKKFLTDSAGRNSGRLPVKKATILRILFARAEKNFSTTVSGFSLVVIHFATLSANHSLKDFRYS